MLDGVDNYLKLLEQNNVPSTFFVLGEIAKSHNNIIIKINSKGHEIGSHGWNHERPINLSKRFFSSN